MKATSLQEKNLESMEEFEAIHDQLKTANYQFKHDPNSRRATPAPLAIQDAEAPAEKPTVPDPNGNVNLEPFFEMASEMVDWANSAFTRCTDCYKKLMGQPDSKSKRMLMNQMEEAMVSLEGPLKNLTHSHIMRKVDGVPVTVSQLKDYGSARLCGFSVYILRLIVLAVHTIWILMCMCLNRLCSYNIFLFLCKCFHSWGASWITQPLEGNDPPSQRRSEQPRRSRGHDGRPHQVKQEGRLILRRCASARRALWG